MLRGAELVPAFCREEIDLLEGLLARRLSPWRCASTFGLPSYAVEHLVELGELEHEDHPYLELRHPRWPYLDTDKVQRYLNTVEASASEVAGLKRPVGLIDLMKQVGGRLKPWATALAAMRSGAINYGLIPGISPLAQRIMVSRQQALHILNLPSPSTSHRDGSPRLLSRFDALEVLNQGFKKSPILARYETKTGARDRQTLTSEMIVAVAAGVISASEIEARYGIGPSATIAHFLKIAGLQRIDGLGWPRDEAVAQLAMFLPSKP